MRKKSLQLIALMALAAATTLYGQPTNGAHYWSLPAPDCTAINNQAPVVIKAPNGATLGYSCQRTGTFLWLAAGAGWTTSIRVAGPALGSIGVDFTFYNQNGGSQMLDFTGSFEDSSDDVNFALFDNQPSQILLLGVAGNGPSYPALATGSVYASFLCPDADTCLNIQPQLIYSALPSIPWSLSVPITWDTELSATWSAVGSQDHGAQQFVSFVVYNEDTIAHSYTIDAYDSNGNFHSRGFTPVILPLEDLGNGALGEGGTYGALISDVLPNLPPDIYKFIIDGGSGGVLSAVSFLQFDGPSAASLQVAFDTPPGPAPTTGVAPAKKLVRGVSPRQQRMKSTSKPLYKTLPRKTASR